MARSRQRNDYEYVFVDSLVWMSRLPQRVTYVDRYVRLKNVVFVDDDLSRVSKQQIEKSDERFP